MIQRVFTGLKAAGCDLDSDDLADTLWLAACGFFPARSPEVAPDVSAEKPPPEIPKPVTPTPANPAPISAPPPAPGTSNIETPVETESDGAAELVAPGIPNVADATPASALPLRTPAASGLPGALDLSRALRLLRRRVPARFATVLDEEETVRKIIEEKVWLPALRPAPARWLELAIVVDASASMLVWHATVRELRLLFERLGAFRDVRVWTIDTAQRDRLTLRSPHAPGARPSAELRDTTGRRAIVVVSDCIAPAWDAALPPVLAKWARQQPVAILQLFPETLWRQTALAATHRVQLSAPAPGVPNAQLRATFPPGPPGWEKPKGPPIPVLTTEPAVLRAWASMVARGGTSNVPAVVFEPEEEIVLAGAVVDLPPERRIAAFQSNASATAFKLACLLAAAPLQLPVMRLVQQALLPGSRQVHLAEVFVSGLLERVTPPGEMHDPDLIEFAFHRGVGELLLGANRAWEMIAVLEKVSEYVNERFGSALDFQALVRDPRLIGDLPVVAGARPFASVAAKVLARFGGKYAQAAKKLRGRVVREEQREQEAVAQEEQRRREARGRKRPFEDKWILWVDDHPERNVAGRARLERERAHVVNVRSTEEAIAKLVRRPFDAIITDLVRGTEEFAGFDLIERVRTRGDAPPVAIYTSVRGLAHERQALEKGALILTSDFAEIQQAFADYFSGKTKGDLAPQPLLTPEPMAEAPDDAPLSRTPHMFFSPPPPAAPGSEFEVEIFADEMAAAAGEESEAIVFAGPGKEVALDVWLAPSAELAVLGTSVQPLRIARNGVRSVSVRFRVKVDDKAQAGRLAPLAALFFHQGRPCGRVTRTLLIGAAGTAPAAGEDAWQRDFAGGVKIESDPPPPPDLTVVVACPDGAADRYEVRVITPLLDAYKAGVSGPWQLTAAADVFVRAMTAKFTKPGISNQQRLDNLLGAGRHLFNAAPKHFREVFWELIRLRKPLRTIFIVSEGPHIPWEIMVPDPALADDDGRAWKPLGVDFAIGRWVHGGRATPPGALSITSACVLAPDYTGSEHAVLENAVAESEYVRLRFGGVAFTPAKYDEIRARIATEVAPLFHFVGRIGVTGDQNDEQFYLEGGETLSATQVRGMEGFRTGFRKMRPMVFLNASGVGQSGWEGFPKTFAELGASGVIAPLWSVRDGCAHKVAVAFYDAVKQDAQADRAPRPVAEILRAIRARAYSGAEAGEDSYAAYFFYGDPSFVLRLAAAEERLSPLSLLRTHTDHEGVILRVCWRPDGAQVATVGVDGGVCIRDAHTGERVALLHDHSQGVNCIAWSPDLRHYATCSFDRTINVYEVAENRRVAHLEGHIADIPSIAWSPSGDGLASCSADGSIIIWAASDDRRAWRQRVVFPNQGTTMHRVLWSLDGSRLYSCSRERVIRVWSPEGEPLEALESHRGAVNDLALSRDGRWLASASADGTFRAWDLPGHSVVVKDRHVDDVRGISFSYDGLLLALNTGRPEGRIEIWRTDRWEQVYEMSEKPSNFWPCNIAWSPAAPILAVLGETDQVLKLWNVDGAALLGTDAS